MTGQTLHCAGGERRALVRANRDFNGLDYLEVSPDQRSLTVYFLDKAPDDLELGNLRVTGGRRVTGIKVTGFAVCANQDPERDDCLVVHLDRAGDYSCYRLEVVAADAHGRPTDTPHPRFDPRYHGLEFTFKVDCPSQLDCLPEPCAPAVWPSPDIPYLAKDFQSFTDLLLDRMAVQLPGWRERSAADLYLTLLELLAYVGDQLSYQQDAIATEAYLTTARLRTSVRRHARLVDYRMHEGCGARVWIVIEASRDLTYEDAASLAFVTDLSQLLAGAPSIIKPAELERLPHDGFQWFEPVASGPVHILKARSTIEFYTWGETQCCLPVGATSATLVDRLDDEGSSELELTRGVVLVFKEVLGPTTGIPGDADPTHRHPVRLTEVQRSVDPLTGVAVLDVSWAAEDALPFALCLSAVGPPPQCAPIDAVSVAHGNVILADHGRTWTEGLGEVPTASSVPPCSDGCPDRPVVRAGRFQPDLSRVPLSYHAPVDLAGPAALVQMADPREALPELTLTSRNGEGASVIWRVRPDLMDSAPGDRHVVVEVDDEAVPHLRFGDDTLGRAPGAGEQFGARYRVGSGPVGNIGPDSIAHLVSSRVVAGVTVRVHNPLPAVGGTAPETVAEVKRFAPAAVHRDRRRAITAADYAELTMRDFPHQVQRAAAELRWTGSWYEARVAVDSTGSYEPPPELLAAVATRLERYRRIGHDVAVVPAAVVGLDVALQICVAEGYRRSDIVRAVLARLGNRTLPDGSLGMFHPDAVTFGTAIAVSALVAAVASIHGVTNARVTRLRRYGQTDVPPPDEFDLPADGVLTFAASEIPRLDNDLAAPEHGVVSLDLRGGR